jgi:hypothetical protein
VVPVLIELLGLLASGLVLLAWFGETRQRWLTARFFAERMRQWHFELFLDGALVSKLTQDAAGFVAERDLRWSAFLHDLRAGPGLMGTFLHSDDYPIAHHTTSYTNDAVADEVFTIYSKLRFEWQLSYFRCQADTFAETDNWTEAAARWTLVAAAIVPLAQLALYGMRGDGAVETAIAVLPPLALLLALVSAVIRVLRSARAYSEERERYLSKWTRALALKAAFDAATERAGRLAVMEEFEKVAIDELRGFLRTMERASYLL